MSKKQFVLMAAACLLLVPASWGSTVVVGHCKSGLASYPTIGAAVTGVPSGSTIYVCPATYPEQVEITGKKLALIGVQGGTADNPTLVPPGGVLAQNAPNLHSGGNPIAAQIWVHDVNASTTGFVNISNLTLDAANNGIDCAPSPVGIVYQNASGTVAHVATRNQMTSPSSNGCQSGYGILVQSGAGTGGSTPLVSTVTVSGSTVHDFQKNGIAGQEDGTTLNATGNTVLGLGPTTGAAQNGIEIAFGAIGKITGNSVADFNFSPGSAGASGILLFDSTGVTVSGNTVANSQYGIAIAESGPGTGDTNTVTSNKISGTHLFDGIDVCSDHNTVKTNTVNSSDESGIHIDDSCGGPNSGNTVTGNIINEACAGILEGTAAPGANITSPNTIFNVDNTHVSGDVCPTTVLNANFASMNLKARSVFVP